ncbi:MAG: response regulator transcription factor [Chloroflexi bacterium]|nr:response regulator transcription factor [Chloroflexota bacterium]MCY4248385.1 response regulator transcription factor [Chloroflexota bacterium]
MADRQLMRLLLVVADDVSRYTLRMTLQREGYVVDEAANGEAALESFHRQDFDLVLADIDLPGMDGFALLRGLKQHSPDVVVILMSADADLRHAVQALRAGAGDFLLMPCASDELRASVELGMASARSKMRQRRLLAAIEQNAAQLTAELASPDRAAEQPTANLRDLRQLPPMRRHVIRLGPFELAPGRYEVAAGEASASLTPTEFDLLLYLAAQRDRVVPCSELVREVRGYHVEEPEAREVIRPHISNLRRKLKDLDNANMIVNVRGSGYRLIADAQDD